MKKTVLNTALSSALIVALGVSVSACGGGEEHEEVLVIDRVDEAAELARENAPDAEEFDFPETEVAAVDGTETATDTDADTDAATDAETTDEVAEEETTDDISTDADAATTESTDMETTEAADTTAE